MLAGVVGVVDVGVVSVCLFSKFVVAVLKISANFSNARTCRPSLVVGSLSSFRIAFVNFCAIWTALSIGVSCGTFACCGYNLYWADVLIPPVLGIWNVRHR